MTSQRKVILEELRKVNTHPTADKLYEMARRRLPHVSLGTVYRNLEILADAGLIQKHEAAGSQRRFDGNTQNHYHIRCVRCGRLEDAPVQPSDSIDRVLRETSDYQILGHRLEFIGVCPACMCRDRTPEEATLLTSASDHDLQEREGSDGAGVNRAP